MLYTSAGLDMTWLMPPRDADHAAEVQAIAHAHLCLDCGDLRTEPRVTTRCPACGSSKLIGERFIRPGGFAVDSSSEPHNDLAKSDSVAFIEPWVSAGAAAWETRGARSLELRHSGSGRVHHRQVGKVLEHKSKGYGYALCLSCGRAAPEVGPPESAEAPQVMNGHRRLRGSGGHKGLCRGGALALKRGLMLGASEETDVVELRLFDRVLERWSIDAKALTSTGLALRAALARMLGIDPRELGLALTSQRDAMAVALFDLADGGAGYCAELPRHAGRLFADARRILECPRSCTAYCHGCLLAYDTQHFAKNMDRTSALALVTPEWLDAIA